MSQSEENYRLLFESNPEAMWVFDAATLRFLAVNDAAIARYGYSRKEFLSMTIKDIRPSSDISKLEQHLQQHPAGTTTPPRFHHRKKDGTEIDVEILAYPITFDGHDARLILARDISELKRKEHQIRLFAHAFESTAEMISLTDLENRFIFVNKSFLEAYGYEEQEILGKQPAVLGSPKNPQKIHDEILDRTLKYGGWKGELYNRRKDGSEFPAYLNTSVIKDKDGNIIGHIGVAQDITERKLAEEALRASEAEFRALFASMSDVILVFDAHGRYIKIAPTNPALLYRPPQELLGKTLHEVFPAAQADLFLDYIKRTLKTRQTLHIEYNLQIDGTEVWFSGAVSPMIGNRVIWVARDITERRQTEEELRESEEFLRTIFNAEPECVKIVSADGKLVQMNPAGLAMIEADHAEDVIGKSVFPLLTLEHRESFRTLIESVFRGNQETLEFEIIGLKGTHRWLETHAVPLHTSNNEIVAMLGVTRNITGRKRAEKIQSAVYRIAQAADIASSLNDLFKLIHGIIQEVMPANNFYIALYDEENDILSFPYFIDEIDVPSLPRKPGKGLTEYVLRTGKSLLCDQALDEKLQRRGEVELVGVSCPIWLGVPLIIEEKTIGVMVVQHYSDEKAYSVQEQQILEFVSSQVAKAIDGRRRQEELALQKSYFQQLFENSPSGIVVFDKKGVILNANKAFEQLFQYTIEELRDRNFIELIVPESLFEDAYDLLKLSQRDQAIQKEAIRKRKDGTLLNVSITAYPIVIDNEMVGMYGIYVNVTERKRLEDQLRQSQKLESLGTLAGGIAHDFNNILSIIVGHAALMGRVQGDPAKLSQSIEVISKASQRGAGLVKQLLTFARKTDIILESVHINDVIQELVKFLELAFPKTITISSQLDTNLPSIIADANQLHQVLLNLCVNARDAIATGGSLVITTALTEGNSVRVKFPQANVLEYVLIQVSDTGTGMDETTQKRIFEPFFTTKERGKGTGLGLATVYGIVESHHGFIDVESTIGHGTTFYLYFPVQPRTLETFDTKEKAIADVAGGSETILLAEDEEMLSELVEDILVEKGYKVLIAKDGEEAVDTYSRHHAEIALVLSDIGLPKLGGREVFLKIKTINPGVKVILASGYIEPNMKLELLKAGAKEFIQKPYNPNEILKKIREAIER